MISTFKSAFARLRPAGAGSGIPAVPPALLKTLYPLLLLAVGVTAVVLMFAWSDQSGYKPVFGAREKIAVADMMTVLDAEHIPYRLHPDSGQVLVPQAMLGKVRMLLAAKGVTAQLPAGLELMDRNDPLGVSQFVQDVRFRRGLEGELAQSILTLDAIGAARVHLSIAKSTSFVSSDGEKSSASVVIATKPGRTLAPEQIAAVINMVAGSVASLSPQRVSLVDQAGTLLSSHIDLTDGYDTNSGNDNVKNIQDAVRRNVQELLGPSVGDANFKLSVTAQVDNDRVDETVEKYGEAPKVTSEATREEQDRNRMAIGVPGTLSNRPPQPVVTPDPAKPADDGANRKNASSRQYAYDRSITQTKRSRGRLQKLSVAVVLNSAAAPAKTGWTAEQLANIERILKSGIGIDSARGDSLAVSVLPFPAKPVPEQWYEQRDNIVDGVSWLGYAAAILLAFFMVVRPLMRMATVRLAPPRAPEAAGFTAAAGASGATALPAAEPAPSVPLLENYEVPPADSAVDVMVEHLKVLAGKEPERVAEVVKQWMQKNGRTD
ncbi:MAG: flagellar MS-ring protein [Massilia sp.]|nr:flagellar MS-ring protein [Massilia sp.]